MAPRTSLSKGPSEQLQREIVSHFWRKQSETISIENYTSYFYYYKRTCQALCLGLVRTELKALSVATHEDLLDMIDALWKLSDKTPNFDRPQLREVLIQLEAHKGQATDRVNNSINLLLRLWLTIRIQDPNFCPAANSIQWDDVSKIQELLEQNFPEPRTDDLNPNFGFESNFTAINLNRICGIRLEWTCQLEEHLMFDLEHRTVKIYALSGFLQDHLSWSVKFVT